MKIEFSARLKQSYQQAPPQVRKEFKKQLERLLDGIRYPSLKAKKYDERRGIWQTWVNRSWRFFSSSLEIPTIALTLFRIRNKYCRPPLFFLQVVCAPKHCGKRVNTSGS